MKKEKYGLFFTGLLAALFLFGSCTQFFSTSLAPWALRDQSKIVPPVNAENVDELVMLAENNPDLSLGLLKGIEKAVPNASPDDKISMQAAALQAAANATGLGHAVFNQVGKLSDALQTPGAETAKELVIDTINDLKNLKEASSALKAILPDPDSEAFKKFVDDDKVSAEDLAIAAALILLASDVQGATKAESLNNLADFGENGPKSEEAKYAVALAEAAVRKGIDDGLFKNLLKELKLAEEDPEAP